MYAYVGSRTTSERDARGEGITVFRLDRSNDTLERVGVVRDLVNPSYLIVDRTGRNLYTVHGDEHSVSAFRIDPERGVLRFLGRQETGGRNPVHLALDPGGRWLVVSNHLGASLAVMPVGHDGTLGPWAQLWPIEGPVGPHRVEQTQPKPHANPFDPKGRHVLVPDKGTDRVFVFRFRTGRLEPAAAPFVVTRAGAGPRHLAFHPSASVAYVVNELDSTVATYRYDAANGGLEPVQVVSTLPPRCTGNNRAAGIVVDQAGRTLYVSNRGDDSIASFGIDPSSRELTFMGAESSQGRTPRFLVLAPGGRSMFVLNESSDSIVRFAVDAASGALSPGAPPVRCGSPVCMVFAG